MVDYGYPWEKFHVARGTLMLPHPRGEEESIADAFSSCQAALDHLEHWNLAIDDEDVRRWLEELAQLMNVEGLEDPARRGLYYVKAEMLSEDDRLRLSRTVDELAGWFRSKMEEDFRAP